MTPRIAAAAAQQHRLAAVVGFDDDIYNGCEFVFRQGDTFAGGAHRHQELDIALHKVLCYTPYGGQIGCAICCKGCHHSDTGSGELHSHLDSL